MNFKYNQFYLQKIESCLESLKQSGYFDSIDYKTLKKILEDLNIDIANYPFQQMSSRKSKDKILPVIEEYYQHAKNNLVDTNLSLQEAKVKYSESEDLKEYLRYKYSLLLVADENDNLILQDKLNYTVLSPCVEYDAKLPYYYWQVYTFQDQIHIYVEYFKQEVEVEILKDIIRFMNEEMIFTAIDQENEV